MQWISKNTFDDSTLHSNDLRQIDLGETYKDDRNLST